MVNYVFLLYTYYRSFFDKLKGLLKSKQSVGKKNNDKS